MMIDLMLGVLIGLIIGSAVTAMFFKYKGGDASTLKNLKAEHEQYRKQVDNHFVNTSILFKGLTDQYREASQWYRLHQGFCNYTVWQLIQQQLRYRAHDANADIKTTAKCFWKLREMNLI